MLELGALLRVGGARQQLQAGIHLKRVGRHGDGALATLPQPVGELNRYVCLAHAGRTEQGDHVRWRHWAGVS